jgi:hypothetical protein
MGAMENTEDRIGKRKCAVCERRVMEKEGEREERGSVTRRGGGRMWEIRGFGGNNAQSILRHWRNK